MRRKKLSSQEYLGNQQNIVTKNLTVITLKKKKAEPILLRNIILAGRGGNRKLD